MKKWSNRLVPYAFILPFVVASVVFTLIPILYSLYISFHDFSFLNPAKTTFAGLENYREVLDDAVFLTSLGNTLKYLIAVVPALVVLSLGLAVLLNDRISLRSYFRSAFYLPYVVPPVAMGVIAVQLFSKESFVAKIMELVGIDPVSWHTRAPWAFWLVAIVMVWSQIGFYMVLYLAGLQNIPGDLYEAARIDGANRLQQFWYVTVPQLRPTTTLVLFMGVLSTLQIFDQPYVISTTGGTSPGSPGDTTLSMVMYIYSKAFRHREIGLASAAAFVVFAIIFAVSIGQSLASRRKAG